MHGTWAWIGLNPTTTFRFICYTKNGADWWADQGQDPSPWPTLVAAVHTGRTWDASFWQRTNITEPSWFELSTQPFPTKGPWGAIISSLTVFDTFTL